MRLKNSRGFSLTEIIIIIAIIAVLIGIATPSMIYFMNRSRTVKMNNIAKSIFLAAQSELTHKKNGGTLADIARFSVSGGRLVLDGGYLSENHATAGKLDEELVSGLDDINKSAIYYLTISKNGSDDSCFLSILDKVDIASEVVINSVCMEFNAGTGNVMTVFYSDRFDNFVYDDSDNQNNLMKTQFRGSSPDRGVYSVDTAGLIPINIESPQIALTNGLHEDGSGTANALYCEAYITEADKEATIMLTDESGELILNADGLPYALTFTVDDIKENDIDWAVQFPYTGLNGDLHAGSIINGIKEDEHVVFKSDGLVDPSGGTVSSHMRVTWMLDMLDTNDDKIIFENSIHVKYPDIGVRNIMARLSFMEDNYTSNISHSYYANQDETRYYIKDARHFNNMRYVALNPLSEIKTFVQLSDIDLLPIKNFAPLNWIPVDMQIDKDGVFAADYYGRRDEISSYFISNAHVSTNDKNVTNSEANNTGIFGVVSDSKFVGICINNAEIFTRQGGNSGAIAGKIIDSSIAYAAVSANVEIRESAGVYNTVNVGGLAGVVENSFINLSYNSGSYSKGGYGSVYASGKYSGSINIGGLAGHVVSGAVSTSYNNARVNIEAAEFNDESYQVENPVYADLSDNYLQNISIGGLVGKNLGTVSNCYSTNFVSDYYDDLEEANCATLIGWNEGQMDNCIGLYNGIDMPGPGIEGNILNKDELKDAFDELNYTLKDESDESPDVSADFFQSGNQATIADENYHMPQNYPYPILSGNKPVFDWENIYAPIGFDLIGDVYFMDGSVRIEAVRDVIHENYVKVNLTNPNADNYIKKLRIDVKYNGYTPFYARVKLNIFSVNHITGQYLEMSNENLKYDNYIGPSPLNELSWFSNFSNDLCYYYTAILRPKSNEEYITLPFVEGAANEFTLAGENSSMYVNVTASGVEKARYGAFWSISKLPWR